MATEPGKTASKDTFRPLANYKYVLLTTFRKNGTPMPTPIWFVYDDGKFYLTTAANVGKVKRVRNNPHVSLVPCTQRGQVIEGAPTVEGKASELPKTSFMKARALLGSKYGLTYRLFRSFQNLRKIKITYLVIEPA